MGVRNAAISHRIEILERHARDWESSHSTSESHRQGRRDVLTKEDVKGLLAACEVQPVPAVGGWYLVGEVGGGVDTDVHHETLEDALKYLVRQGWKERVKNNAERGNDVL